MRILFVGMPNSIHTARWIMQIINEGWDIFLFPTYPAHLHPDLKNIKYFASYLPKRKKHGNRIRFIWWTIPFFLLEYIQNKFRLKTEYFITSKILAFIIRWIKPDIIHSLEIQHAGYLTYEARVVSPKNFPCWIVTNWGSDIYLFSRLEKHKEKIVNILSLCQYYSCECVRDINLAINLGFKGKVLPILPNTGGFDFQDVSIINNNQPPSSRKKILLKGYQNWAGRALFGLQSLRNCSDFLKGYTLAISVSNQEVQIAAELFSQETGVPIEIIPICPHEEMLKYYQQSRIYIGLSISDGISTSLLEAMVMGAFPIQSNTACADEWIEDGISGFIVPPEDTHEISNKIRKALKDDFLVDRAAKINIETAIKRLDYSSIQHKVVEMYENIYSESKE